MDWTSEFIIGALFNEYWRKYLTECNSIVQINAKITHTDEFELIVYCRKIPDLWLLVVKRTKLDRFREEYKKGMNPILKNINHIYSKTTTKQY